MPTLKMPTFNKLSTTFNTQVEDTKMFVIDQYTDKLKKLTKITQFFSKLHFTTNNKPQLHRAFQMKKLLHAFSMVTYCVTRVGQ